MKKTSMFLGNTGLSSSEANHTANVVKELAQSITREVTGRSLFKEILKDPANAAGDTAFNFVKEVPKLEEKILQEGALYGLSAWLREGIKAKQNLLSAIQNTSLNDIIIMDDQPGRPKLIRIPDLSEMLEELTIAERAEYLMAESKAAHIGKKIHVGGIIPTWKDTLKNLQPVRFVTVQTQVFRVDVTPLTTPEELDALSTTLQKEWRQWEQKVNYYKAKLNNLHTMKVSEISSANAKMQGEYSSALSKWNADTQTKLSEARAKQAQELKEASELKIVIPIALEDTLKYVQTFSQK